MSLFVMSDPHLSVTVPKPMDVFGSRWTGYRQKIEKYWRAVVSPADTVILPGDISWGMTLEEAKEDLRLLDALPGQKIISRGNHDYWWASAAKNEALFKAEGITTLKMLHNNAFLTEGKLICGSRGWWNDEKAAPKGTDYQKLVAREAGRLRLSIEAGLSLAKDAEEPPEILVFLHFPPIFGDYACPEILDVLRQYRIRRCFYGHIHGSYDMPGSFTRDGITFTLVSADYLGFVPMKIE